MARWDRSCVRGNARRDREAWRMGTEMNERLKEFEACFEKQLSSLRSSFRVINILIAASLVLSIAIAVKVFSQ